MRTWIMAAAALAVAAPASAQVTLAPGQGVTLTFGGSGEAMASDVHPAALGPHDMDALEQMRIAYKAAKPKPGVLPPVVMNYTDAAPAITPGRIEIVFVVIGEKDSVLAIVNGYARGMTYRATITTRGRAQPTDVCLVLPGRRGYEHWPYAIEKIELTEFTLVDWAPGDSLPCR